MADDTPAAETPLVNVSVYARLCPPTTTPSLVRKIDDTQLEVGDESEEKQTYQVDGVRNLLPV